MLTQLEILSKGNFYELYLMMFSKGTKKGAQQRRLGDF
jgi:hypothetical protein